MPHTKNRHKKTPLPAWVKEFFIFILIFAYFDGLDYDRRFGDIVAYALAVIFQQKVVVIYAHALSGREILYVFVVIFDIFRNRFLQIFQVGNAAALQGCKGAIFGVHGFRFTQIDEEQGRCAVEFVFSACRFTIFTRMQ